MSIRQDVFFLTYDGRVTTQPVSEGLFVSNGTAAGTSEAIALQAPYPGSLGPAAALTYTSVFGIGGTFYATDPTTGSPLPIASFPAPSEVLSPLSLGAVAVFVATMPSGGAGLARTDGTAAGTFFITPSGAAANFNPVILGRVGNLAILEGLGSNGTAGIWATDGTNANTVLIGTAPSGTLQALGVSNGQLVVAGITSGAIPTLTSLTYINCVTGQTQSQAVTGIAVNSGLTLPDGLLLLGGSSGLFATSGPGTAITKISSLVDPTIDYVSTVGDANSFVNAGGVAFFTVTTTGPFGVSEIALWTSNGTASGTHIVSTGSGTSQTTDGTDIYDLTALGSKVLFAALDPSTSGDSGSSGLWVTDGSTAGTKEIAAGINPIAVSVIGNTAFITGSNGIYTSNGTAAGTAVIATENPVNTPTVLTDTTRIAVTGTHTQYELAPTGAGALQIADTVADRDGSGVYAGASIVAFSDGTGVLDPTGNGEAVARLYQAALDRAPDIGGLTGSITALDAGTVSLAQLGNLFVTSPEFLNDYGTLSNSGFVTQLYANALDRAPDPSSFATDVAALNAGLSRGTLLIDIGESFEARQDSIGIAGDANDATVYRLYEAIDDRAPDSGGLQAYSAALGAGQTIQQLATAMLAGAEYTAKFGSPDNGTFVTELYQNLLGRSPDAGGFATYTSALASGTSRAAIVTAFVTGDEGRLVTNQATHDGWVFIP